LLSDDVPLLDAVSPAVPLLDEVDPSLPLAGLEVDDGCPLLPGAPAEGTAGGWAVCCWAQPASHAHEARMATMMPAVLL